MRTFLSFSLVSAMSAVLVFSFLPLKSMADHETGLPAQAGDAQSQPQQQAEQPFVEEEEQGQEEFVDPREIRDTLRQLNDLNREAQRTLKKAQKIASFTNEVQVLQDILSQIATFSNAIKNASPGDQRDALQEFYDAQLWDTLNEIRTKIELPQELKSIEREVKRLEKLIGAKKFSIERVDLAVVRTAIDEIKNAVVEARSQFDQGNFEDAREALQVIYEGGHPGEMYGVLQQLREMNQRLKRMKTEAKEMFHEALEPVYEAIRAGDFGEANMMLQDIRNDLWRLFDKVKGKSGVNADMQQKLQKLEERLQQKQQQIQNEESVPGPQSYQPSQASVLDAVSNRLNNLFGR